MRIFLNNNSENNDNNETDIYWIPAILQIS